MHPVVQLVGAELRLATAEDRDPNWNNVTLESVRLSCLDLSTRQPDWHGDLSALILTPYFDTVPSSKIWWVPEPSEVEEVEDGSFDSFV